MYEFLHRSQRGQLGVYLQFLVILLIMSAGITYAMAISGCDCDGGGHTGAPSVRLGVPPPEATQPDFRLRPREIRLLIRARWTSAA